MNSFQKHSPGNGPERIHPGDDGSFRRMNVDMHAVVQVRQRDRKGIVKQHRSDPAIFRRMSGYE
jgi:hypothetical protein